MNLVPFMREALRLARRGLGTTSPNPMVGAVLVKRGKIIGRGWHRRAGGPHAEIEALNDARKRGQDVRGSALYVTLEPCSTQGKTPSCTEAIKAAGIRVVIVGATDPNPAHAGRGYKILRRAGIKVVHGVLADEATRLNEAFNHWIVKRTPFAIVKAAMTLDGKIATARGESKWITGPKARARGMKLRQGADAVLVGVNTVLADDPALTLRKVPSPKSQDFGELSRAVPGPKKRIILDSLARTPLNARVVRDEFAAQTIIVVGKDAPKARVAALAKKVRVLVAPLAKSTGKDEEPKIDVRWLMKKLGREEVTSVLVEGGGEVNASFLLGGLAQRVAFFYAPKILGGRDARKAVAGVGVQSVAEMIRLRDVEFEWLGPDLMLTARVS
jgi:diaminohydroxyphosphoribosylaminopyrimidine deaminase / 5-amino-6-(5-phosphoribosylamino)uracil reductase